MRVMSLALSSRPFLPRGMPSRISMSLYRRLEILRRHAVPMCASWVPVAGPVPAVMVMDTLHSRCSTSLDEKLTCGTGRDNMPALALPVVKPHSPA